MLTSSEDVQPFQVFSSAQNDDELQQTYRSLFAWMDDQQAIQARASFLTDTLENHLQPIVRIDDLETRWSSFQECQEQIYEICFPAEQPIKFAQIQDARGYTISRLSPNFGIGTVPLNPVQSFLLNVTSDPSSLPASWCLHGS